MCFRHHVMDIRSEHLGESIILHLYRVPYIECFIAVYLRLGRVLKKKATISEPIATYEIRCHTPKQRAYGRVAFTILWGQISISARFEHTRFRRQRSEQLLWNAFLDSPFACRIFTALRHIQTASGGDSKLAMTMIDGRLSVGSFFH